MIPLLEYWFFFFLDTKTTAYQTQVPGLSSIPCVNLEFLASTEVAIERNYLSPCSEIIEKTEPLVLS